MSIIDEANRDLKALLQKCKVTYAKIEGVWDVECPEEEDTMSEQQTFKHLIEYKGHTYLIETTFEFQPMSFDPKGGYVPYLKVIHTREIDLEEKTE